jgi:PPOX class probable F420-dependent enzyme
MSDDEVAALLRESRKLQLATINPDGTPHLVTMFYGLDDGRITFWTYAKSQKARNLERDPRVTCLIETGDDYAELRGFMLYGTAKRVDEREHILAVGLQVVRRMVPDVADEHLLPQVELSGRKRIAYIVEPARVVSWDHRRLT